VDIRPKTIAAYIGNSASYSQNFEKPTLPLGWVNHEQSRFKS